MRTTLRDIANYVGTSVTTVSKVLGNREIRVSESTRQEIIDAAKKLNYLQNASGVSLKKGRTDAIAVVVGDLLYPYYAKLLKQFSYCLNEYGKSVVVCDADNNFCTEMQHYERLKSGYADGVIVVPSPLTATKSNVATTVELFDRIDIPAVFIHHGTTAFNHYTTVGANAYQCGVLAAEHLLSLGHRRIAYVSESLEKGAMNPKLLGFRAALAQNGVTYCEDLTLYGYARYIGGAQAYQKLASSKATAVVCSDDLLAIGMLTAAIEAGRRIPDELSVLGMDNIMATLHTTPKVSTISQNTVQIARNAVDLLIKDIDARKCGRRVDVSHIAVEPEIVARGSTGSRGAER